MHVAFLTPEYPTGPCGGIGTSVRNLAGSLVHLGHRVTVLGWGRSAEFEDRGVKVRFLAATRLPRLGWLLNRWRAGREINLLVRQDSLQVVEAADWCGMSAFMRPRCPLVIRCNGSATYFDHLLNQKAGALVRRTESCALRQADSLAAVSAFTAAKTAEIFALRHPICVIPNGIDVSQFTPAPEGEVEADSVLYFGTMARKKGVLDLPDIFLRLLALRPEARLTLIGRDNPDRQTAGPSTWSLLEAAVPAEHRAKMKYLGPAPYHGLQDYVRKAAVCAFPSYAEAFPLTWLEAMACAKPIVGYDLGWAREVLEPGVSGLLVPPGNTRAFARAVAELLAAPEERRLLGQAARRRVEQRFSASVVAHQTLAWYTRVLSAPR
jgi:glycosyltransferase involved in cell wall biosynthesis